MDDFDLLDGLVFVGALGYFVIVFCIKVKLQSTFALNDDRRQYSVKLLTVVAYSIGCAALVGIFHE